MKGKFIFIISLIEIEKLSKDALKHMIKMACEKKALDYLNDQKMKHSKVQHINHRVAIVQNELRRKT